MLVARPTRQRAVERRHRPRPDHVAAPRLLARDLANSPPSHLTATPLAALATEVGKATGLDVEVFDVDRLAELGCGGLLGVNAGSAEPPRMIKLTYRPKRSAKPAATSRWSARASCTTPAASASSRATPMHAAMKMDMSGAAAVLSTMSALAGARLPQRR